MAYFPAFIKLDDLDILIVGGGNVALEKLEHLLVFTKNIKIIAPYISKMMQKVIDENNLTSYKRKYKKGDIKDIGIVIVAVDDIYLQREIYEESKKYVNCLCNSVDSVSYCDFIFPSYIKKDDLTIAVSTSGASPSVAKYLRKFLEHIIPNDIGDFLKQMRYYRKSMPKGKQRMEFLDEKAKDYVDSFRSI